MRRLSVIVNNLYGTLLSCRVVVTVSVITVAPSTCLAARPVTLSDLGSSVAFFMHSLALSPDGERVVVENETKLSLRDIKSGSIQKDLGEGLMANWSPNGESLAFYSNRSGLLQIWLWDVRTDKTEMLTDLPGGVDPDPTTRIMNNQSDALRLSWSADSSQIIFASRVPAAAQSVSGPLVFNNSTPEKWTSFGIYANPSPGSGVTQIADGRTWGYRHLRSGEQLNSQLFVVDVTTDKVSQLTKGAATFFHPTFSPDGKSIAASKITSSDPIEELQSTVTQSHSRWRSEIVVIDARNETERVIVSDGFLKYVPTWSPDGLSVAFLSSKGLLSPQRIRVVTLANGKQAIESPDLMISGLVWATAGDFLISYASDGKRFANIKRGSMNVEPFRPPSTDPAAGVASPDEWSRSRDGSLAWTHESQLWFWSPSSGKSVKLAEFDPVIGDLLWGRTEKVAWRTHRGDRADGELLYPPGYQPGKRYPVIVDAYTYPGVRTWNLPWGGNQAWGSLGYVVFKAAPRAPYTWMGCAGRPAYCEEAKGPRGWQIGTDDLMSGVDYLIKRGIADPNRMCLFGHSNGGGFVSYLVTRTSRFKCAVVLSPAGTDFIRPVVLNTDGGEIASYLGGLTLANNANDYLEMSSAFHLHSVKTPMLIAAGDQDGEFLLNAIEVYNGVRRAGTEVTFIRYPDQGHLFTGPALSDFWAREIAFFARFLHPTPAESLNQK